MSWDYALRDEHLLIKDEECFVIALKKAVRANGCVNFP